MPPTKKKGDTKSIPPECIDFATARGRPALFLFVPEFLDLMHAVRVRNELKDQDLDDVDVVINSGGGSVHAAYQIAEVLRMHCADSAAGRTRSVRRFWRSSSMATLRMTS